MKVSRRDFLKTSAAGAAAATMSGGIIAEAIGSSAASKASDLNKWPGRVVVNFNKNALTGTPAEQTVIRKKMVDDAVCKLTDQTDVGEAWKAVFPASGSKALTATSKIAIKIPFGCSSSPALPHIDHVSAMVDGLKQMKINGTAFSGSITIYECKTAMCSGQPSGFGYTNASTGATVTYHTSMQNFGDGWSGRAYAPTLNAADFLINVFTPRGHSGNYVTLGFKNHFGTYDPTSGHTLSIEGINNSGPVFAKTVLCMCSAIYANAPGNGPAQSSTNYNTYAKQMDASATGSGANTLILTTDPVTAEAQAFKIMRMNMNQSVDPNTWPSSLQYLKNSASMGVINPTDVRTILNATTYIAIPGAGQGRSISAHVTATHIKGHNSTFIQYALPQDHVGKEINFEIYNTKGVLVRKVPKEAMGTISNFSWDETDASNKVVRSGVYIVRLVAGSMQMSTQLAIMR
jgi:hypothetical protein